MRGYTSIRSKTLITIIAIAIVIVCTSIESNAAYLRNKQNKRVLFISAYSPSFETFFEQVEGIRSQFRNKNIELDVEFMDSKRFYTEENLNNFYKNLKYKLKHLPKYDAVIVGDDNALTFITKYQTELFPKVPIVFLGINNMESAKKASNNPYISGITESISIKDTIKMACKLNQSASNVIALTDNTETGRAELEEFYNVKDKLSNLTFKSIDLSKITFYQFCKELEQITDNDLVLMMSVYKDVDNKKVSYYEGLDMILQHCTQPVYLLYSHGLGYGALGGKIISHHEQGVKAASIVNDILFNGYDIKDIQYINKSPNKYIVDYNVIKQYGLDERILPNETEFINKKTSFLEEYSNYIFAGGFIVLLQFSLIAFLQINITRRKKTEFELLNSREELISSNDELAATNEELTASLEERKVQDEKINALVYTDLLTGLNNRFSIFEIIEQAIKNENGDRITGIMFLDLDNFKNINDTYGHDIGDLVIKKIGKRLRRYESKYIHIGRFGGDEFLVLAKCQDSIADIKKLVKSLQKVFLEKIIVGNNALFLSVSIGISLMPFNGNTRRELVKKADLALYRAKDLGKNTYVFYKDIMSEALEEKMKLQSAIKEAVKNKEFLLKYQPYLDISTNEVLGFEALIRWNSKEHGHVPTYKLITNVEEIGLMVEIGEWVLKQACTFAKKINEDNNQKYKVSINISALQLMQNDFYTNTMTIVNNTGVDPSLICLEMTETILIESLDKGITEIERLKEQGFGIALDDFGTGYSSLKYFKELPVTILKIDRSFIENITSNEYDQNLINVMVTIAHYKGVEVISEGVENREQLDILKKYGCDTVQGFLFSRPLCEKDIIKFIQHKTDIIKP